MKHSLRSRALILLPALTLFGAQLPAQDNAELLSRMKAMEERIKALEAEVATLKGQPPPAAPAPAPAPAEPTPAPAEPASAPQEPAPVVPQQPAGAPQLGGAGAAAAKILNPDISVIGDFLGAAGSGGGRGTPALEMHEGEVGFQEIIDPYARADFFLSFGEEGVNLEEGYLTFTALPAGLQLKVGKMRAAFGKVNTLHNHVLPWTDRPLVTQNLVGGEDGINDAGLSLSRILPAPKGFFLEGTAQVFRGDSAGVFHAAHRGDVSTIGHLRAYRDLNESTNIDFGGSFARGHSAFAGGSSRLFGIDATLRWKPLRRAIYHSLVARSEFIWTRTAWTHPEPAGSSGPAEIIRPFGFYLSADYQLGRRWFLGARFDRSQRGNCLPTDPETTSGCALSFSGNLLTNPVLQDTGGSLLLTYWPSEFSQIRGQLRRTSYGEGRTANELLFQFQFSMGAHGAHPF